MEIGHLTTRSALTVKATDSLYDAAVSMMERGVGSAVILTDGKPSGIVTDRESLRAIAQGKDAKRCAVGEFVAGKLTTVSESLEIMEAARVMREKAFRHLVVVNDDGGLVGVFSMRDLVVGLMEVRGAVAGAAPADGAA